MFSKLMPREGHFFELFNQLADRMSLCSHELKGLISDISSIDVRSQHILMHEHEADKIIRETMLLLHHVFITPIDRADIRELVNNMDDVLDMMEDVAQCISLYDIKKVPEEANLLADLCVRCVEHIKPAVFQLANLKNSDEILKHCAAIDRLESEADSVMRSMIVKLFREEPDTREIIKMKAIIEILETVTDRCADVANVIEGIVLEYA